MTDNAEQDEHPAARRMREQFESKYGDLSDVMRAINHYWNTVEDFRRPYNSEMESPVTNADMDAAEEAMLAEIRRFGTCSAEQKVDTAHDSEQRLRESLRYRWLLANAIASDENGNIVIHYETNRDFRAHGDAESIQYWVNTDVASDSKTFDGEEDRLGYAAIVSLSVEGK